jgi:uncharacterized protein
MKEITLKIVKILGKFILLILIWSGGIATLSQFEKQIENIGKPLSAFIFEFLPLIFILIPSIILWKFLEKEKLKDLGFETKKIFKNILSGTILGVLWIGLAIVGIYLTCKVELNINLNLGLNTILIYFIILLVNTIMQEVLCRGYLYTIIEKSFNSNYAIVFTAVFFVLLHPGAIAAGLVGVTNVFCAGLVFGITRKMTGNLWMPIAIHITWNFIDSILLGTSPLGLYPHLDWLVIHGKEIFTGGKDGLGASIITIFTFPFVFIILCYDIFRIKNTNEIK